jgi:hypothetical protein
MVRTARRRGCRLGKRACSSYPQVEIGKAAITFLMGLLTPVGALIKAVITIVNTVIFIRNASRLPWRCSSVVSLLSDDTDLDGHAWNETERAGRVESSANSAASVANPRDA